MVKVRDDVESHVISQNMDQWLNKFRPRYFENEWLNLNASAKLFDTYCQNQVTNYHYDCYKAGIESVEILSEMNVDAATLSAALLYYCVRFGKLTIDSISQLINSEIAKLTEGVVQLSNRHQFSNGPQIQHDKLRKMLLAVVEDVRVVLIKLAERLVALRSLRLIEENESKTAIAQITKDIYAPLANRLGIGFIKWELEDYAFRYLEPEAYKQIAKLLAEKRLDREHYIKKVIGIAKQALVKENIEAEVYGRVKHIYSIWRKMQRKCVDFNEIYDVRAIRIITSEIRDCYGVLGIIHSLWQHVPKEFDDYIATAKENGYRSLHTAVIGPEGRVIEIQIRTYEMHNEAELGVAAHWLYKEGGKQTSDYHKKVASLRKVLEYNSEIDCPTDSDEALRSELFNDRVYALTPHGDIFDLPYGSTPIDFAYHVHTEVGHCCRGAKVNGAMVSLNYKLCSGDQVEILVGKYAQPSRDWLRASLGYVKSARAKAKIHAWFRKQEQISYEPVKTVSQELIKPELASPVALKKPSLISGRSDVTVAGIGNLMCHFAKCCKPAPGDEIIGYITLGRGVAVHRNDCDNIKTINGKNEARLISINWTSAPIQSYPVDIQVLANDRLGLLNDVISILNKEKVNVLGISTQTHKNTKIAVLRLTLEIKNTESLKNVMNKVFKLSGVITTERIQSNPNKALKNEKKHDNK